MALSRGSVRRYRRTYGTFSINQLENQAVTRVGKQSKQGPRKGSRPPGNHSRQIKR